MGVEPVCMFDIREGPVIVIGTSDGLFPHSKDRAEVILLHLE
jgi:hypothetical protein